MSDLLEELMRSEDILDKRNHDPSPLSTLGRYRNLCGIVSDLKRDLPAGITLLEVVDGVRETTWAGLKNVMSKYVDPLLNPLRSGGN